MSELTPAEEVRKYNREAGFVSLVAFTFLGIVFFAVSTIAEADKWGYVVCGLVFIAFGVAVLISSYIFSDWTVKG